MPFKNKFVQEHMQEYVLEQICSRTNLLKNKLPEHVQEAMCPRTNEFKNKLFENKNAKHKPLTVTPFTVAPWQQPAHWAVPNYMMGAYVQQPKESLDSLDR